MAKKVAKSTTASPRVKTPSKTAKKSVVKKKAPAKRKLAVPPKAPDAPDARVLDRLWETVFIRADASPNESHSARLLARGTGKVAQKFGEEAVECVIEAVAKNRTALVGESADVLYHLLVLWVDAGLRPEDVWNELIRRESLSGLAEKAARKLDLPGFPTKKIP